MCLTIIVYYKIVPTMGINETTQLSLLDMSSSSAFASIQKFSYVSTSRAFLLFFWALKPNVYKHCRLYFFSSHIMYQFSLFFSHVDWFNGVSIKRKSISESRVH